MGMPEMRHQKVKYRQDLPRQSHQCDLHLLVKVRRRRKLQLVARRRLLLQGGHLLALHGLCRRCLDLFGTRRKQPHQQKLRGQRRKRRRWLQQRPNQVMLLQRLMLQLRPQCLVHQQMLVSRELPGPCHRLHRQEVRCLASRCRPVCKGSSLACKANHHHLVCPA
jgi:hypothetical protein